MPIIHTIIVVHTTSTITDANSDAPFSLNIYRQRPPPQDDKLLMNPNFPSLPHNEREKGLTDCYSFDFTDDPINWISQTENLVTMRMIGSNDGWLPQSIFVIGIQPDRNAIVLGSHPAWPSTNWFDRGRDPIRGSRPEYGISGFS
ncbi:hypothetical protein [Nocardia abscessus]|uniref:hypothetical protein n=1 Tax=Nocardia abscessus TaxID=120957 RepID=UPI0024558738|nr:hypothetical protein [Nocardia abscessus]